MAQHGNGDRPASGHKLSPKFFQSLLIGNPEAAQKIKALFGDSVDCDLNFRFKGANGTVSASASGPNAGVNFDGSLREWNGHIK